MCELLENLQHPFKVCRVDNCGLRVNVQVNGGFVPRNATFHLLAKECPHIEVYKISLGRLTKIETSEGDSAVQDFYEIDWSTLNEFFISWYNSVIRVGLIGKKNILEFPQKRKSPPTIIGYAKFLTMTKDDESQLRWSDWIFDNPPETVYLPKSINIKDKYQDINLKLHWRSLDGDKLPANAVIGGFQNDPIYIARAKHRGSLCPGKYLRSRRCAYIPWGFHEHRKDKFEILCGLNVQWVKCKGRDIPDNAFIGGLSELDNEPLYIGRARYGSDLICGKVHALYGTCYLPYNGCELEYETYEILVTPEIPSRSIRDSQLLC